MEGKVISIVIIVVALLTNVTAIQRIVWVQRRASGVPLDGALPARGAPSRASRGGLGAAASTEKARKS
jgi:hypothetical protein